MFQRNKSKTDSTGSKKKVQIMESKPDSSLPAVTVDSDSGENGGPPGPSPKYRDDNFFDFHGDTETDIWGPTFTKTLRKTSQVFEAMPFIPDTSVEKIGGAFVDEERSLKPLVRRNAAIAETTDSPLDRYFDSASSSNDYDRIKELERRVEDLEVARWQPPTIADTINRLLLGKSCSLSWYKSIEEKKQLLDKAINTLDGNCIMAVILFIRKTVDESILLNILERYPVATQHYSNFLKQLKDWKALKALYRRLDDYDNLGYFSLQECSAHGLDKDERIRLIRSCFLQFKNLQLKHQEDVQHVEEYSRLVNKQIKIEEAAGHGNDTVLREDSVLFRPLTTTLLYCCRHYRGQERSIGYPEDMKKLFNISERQFFQMDLLALVLHRDWKGIGSLLTSKGPLGFGKKKKSPIGFERVVRLLGQDKYRTPEHVLVQYLQELDDLEVRYELSMDIGLYDTALECLKLLKDRERVRALINHIPPNKHFEYRSKIERVLANSQIKWKS